MARPKKRAPGAGRKPQGDFEQLTSTFSVRMPQDLREQLEAAAQQNRRSIGQELLRRLYDSFGVNRDKARDPATRALCFLFAEVVTDINFASEVEGWHRSPFMFEAIKLGFLKVLDELQPEGEEEPEMASLVEYRRQDNKNKSTPFFRFVGEQAKIWKSARRVGNDAARRVLHDLFVGPLSTDEVRAFWSKEFPGEEREMLQPLAEFDVKRSERTLYGMMDVRRDLELIKIEDDDKQEPKSRK
jgi:hypothetical protein